MPVFHVVRAPADAVFIGRPSRWGNPYNAGTREQNIARFRRWLWREIRSGALPLAELAALDGQALACYCKPKPCHGDVLEVAAAWAAARVADVKG